MNSKEKILSGYYKWLCSLINPTPNHDKYSILTKALYDKEFHWTVRNDNNRVYEGKNLREKFCDINQIDYIINWFDESVSVLEVLIGLAYRCESVMEDTDHDKEMPDWFWIMLTNAGLNIFTDKYYYNFNIENGIDPESLENVDKILNKIINRKYFKSGKGGLFPLMSPQKDQREVELWYQMNAYLVENYYDEYFGL